MRLFLLVCTFHLGICSLNVVARDGQPINECLECHLDMDEEFAMPAELFPQDIHAQRGFTCADCHGGSPTTDDMDEAHDPEMGFIGVPAPQEIPFMCERCHGDPVFMQQYNPSMPVDQVAKYWSSEHGKGLLRGDMEVATCGSCHNIHAILPKTDPRSMVYPINVAATCNSCHGSEELMWMYDLPTTVFTDFSLSVHGIALMEKRDLSAPTCNDCHGNHGAIPPSVTSVRMVCGQCHLYNQELIEQTTMSVATEKKGFHTCVICHGNHKIISPTDEMIGVEEEGVCKGCHNPGDPGALQAVLIRGQLDELKTSILKAAQKVAEAENMGMEVDDALFDIQSAREVLIKSRTQIHSLDGEAVSQTAGPGLELANRAFDHAAMAIVGFRNRRIGLGVSTVIITFLVIVVYLYIRRTEGR